MFSHDTEKRRAPVSSRRLGLGFHCAVNSMAVVMGLPFVARMVMLMGLQFNWFVLVDMPLFVPIMDVWMYMLVGMRVVMFMGVGMCVLLLPMLVGMLMFMLVPVLVFMCVVVFAVHMDSPPFLIN
jgi:hypothetical protein